MPYVSCEMFSGLRFSNQQFPDCRDLKDGEARGARAASRLRPSRNANGGAAAEGLSSCSSGPISWLFAAGWIIWDIQLVSANGFSRKSTPNWGVDRLGVLGRVSIAGISGISPV
jgi:hypothetical protein